ncbi:hypothetical protein GE21DRAFT_9541 [Neurospora crassa]|uniref:C2H2 transcription factor n=1 Tax=Neurospora crassa (strain ATCC 24698 / 74-OR23-1A / CBS 708.71 / DSM 1257 / FGSC 987) TaxID=367110 RepID=Q7RXC0_NEUCR|nr:C2H2 transcription factor [Neurospora crassa OR74A]EAA27202.1 C2H2 transcription factor [Neurospora crassa OR74A]KHE83849.1 hypothetical protein GE21DRAFT_9541 [Neurospora crassa]|eukprot:XP_956438.1 C2H2 transcription factor [Neurospora crassa OR74A]
MAATFRPVNTPLSPSADSPMVMDSTTTITSPTTPRPSTAPSQSSSSRHLDDNNHHPVTTTTPTRTTPSFGAGVLASQQPLPTSPFPDSVQLPDITDRGNSMPRRENSQHSRKSKDSDDMDMDESDGEGAGEDGHASDDEEINADGTKSKKKKSQRFYCTDYPPCNLSFTRSEHLARHIRKHTGERPFQCHCGRRFSRLDNLRQHAQTVHVNEEIPGDSLAATGTRFQRQIRTDRVRQAGGRARAATAGSVMPVVRGHSKSMSTSSIPNISQLGAPYGASDARRRPPPLVMADPRARVSMEYHGPDGAYHRGASPSDFGTPTSATFSTGQNSPRWGPGMVSPNSSHSRSHSMYVAGARTPGRRLSVPSGGNPFQSPHGSNVRGPLFGPSGINTSNNGAFSPSQSTLLASPTVSNASGWSRRDSLSSVADDAWRRRTWHPESREFNNGVSRLREVITPSQFTHAPPPIANPANQSPQPFRLPGIESFDEPHRPLSPPRRLPSPMMVDAPRPAQHQPPHPNEMGFNRPRELSAQWDTSLHRGLTGLNINTQTPPRDGASAWANDVNHAAMSQADRTRAPQGQPGAYQQTVRFDTEVQTVPAPLSRQHQHQQPSGPPPPPYGRGHHHTMSAPSITSQPTKRHGWYNGSSGPAGETIHEGRARVDRIMHPNVAAFQGFPARDREQPPQQQAPSPQHHHQGYQQQQQQQQYQHQGPPVGHQQQQGGGPPTMERILEKPHPNAHAHGHPAHAHPHQHPHGPPAGGDTASLRRLEALVAVAVGSSEGTTAAAY